MASPSSVPGDEIADRTRIFRALVPYFGTVQPSAFFQRTSAVVPGVERVHHLIEGIYKPANSVYPGQRNRRRDREIQPAIVLAPVRSPNQHPDHIAVGEICGAAARLARYGGIDELRDRPAHAVAHFFGYAVTPAAEPAHDRAVFRVDISAQFERWLQLMECHQTQLRTRQYVELQTARARLLGVEAGVEYAQALFTDVDWLVETVSELPKSIRLF
jgi:hypothetical protein